MSVQIVVGEAQDIEQSLRLFQRLLDGENGRPWYKRRFGYYEKPSALRRKRRKMNALGGGKGPHPRYPRHAKWDCGEYISPPSFPCMGYEEQWVRTGPINAAGRKSHYYLPSLYKMQMHRQVPPATTKKPKWRWNSKRHWSNCRATFGWQGIDW